MGKQNPASIQEWVYENEPVTRSEIREEFGRNGEKQLAVLLDEATAFEGQEGEYWVTGPGR